jgi:hypothetical protein
MTVRSLLNLTLSVWKAISVPDNLLALLLARNVDVLFVLPDANKSLKVENKLFSPHIDPLYIELSKYYCCLSIARPITRIQSSKCFQKTLTFNWLYILLRGSMWKLVLVRFQPKVVVGIDFPKALVISAKEQNIAVVDLYHGFGCGPDDTVYFSKFKDERKYNEWPTEIIVYDDQSYKTLTKMLPDAITVILARNYWFDFLETVGQKYLSFVRSSLEDKLDKYQKVVLVSLQHGYDGSRDHLAGILDNGLIHSNALQLIDDRKDILFILKPHPVQVVSSDWKNVWQFLNSLEETNDNVVFERVVNTDIFSLLMLSDVHVTMSSSAIYEAGLLERPSIALCPTLQKGGLMQDAFKVVEDKGLLTRAKLNGLDLVQFFDNPAHFTKIKKKHAGYNEYAQPAASKVDTILKKAD